ncbi:MULTISPECIES: hypothetical protein [Streptomyces albovinaceus subgroup]|nr:MULTISPECIES: hypothetical protein [Streptomyces]RDL08887.1 hypothetical protein DER30_2269 [Streptomyces sp. HB202]WSF76721.1 hypothetical protein OG838_11320 [Streptomyces globisporus]WSU81166.1 hypothetical protein OG215_11150 [Streptomyces globisporus]WSV89823.1 hypothetical protein OG449_10885 [Streptomyces globisporus]
MTDHCCAVMTTQVNWHCDRHDPIPPEFQDEGWVAPPRQEEDER